MKKVLITGASRGLGLEMAKIFHENRYELILHSREREIPKFDGAKYIYRDLSVIGIPDRVLCVEDIDIFINNASSYINGKLENIDACDIEEIINASLLAPALIIKELWPLELIVNINSLAGKTASYGESIYCASKFGLRGFSESITRDASEAGGRIVDVYLGAMKTDMTKYREDHDKLINPTEAAKIIFEICKARETLQIRELTITRTNYEKRRPYKL